MRVDVYSLYHKRKQQFLSDLKLLQSGSLIILTFQESTQWKPPEQLSVLWVFMYRIYFYTKSLFYL